MWKEQVKTVVCSLRTTCEWLRPMANWQSLPWVSAVVFRSNWPVCPMTNNFTFCSKMIIDQEERLPDLSLGLVNPSPVLYIISILGVRGSVLITHTITASLHMGLCVCPFFFSWFSYSVFQGPSHAECGNLEFQTRLALNLKCSLPLLPWCWDDSHMLAHQFLKVPSILFRHPFTEIYLIY